MFNVYRSVSSKQLDCWVDIYINNKTFIFQIYESVSVISVPIAKAYYLIKNGEINVLRLLNKDFKDGYYGTVMML